MTNAIFLSATEARQNAFAETVVHTEGRNIEDAILAAIAAGFYEVTVNSNTPMTNAATTPLPSNVNVSTNTITITGHPYQTGSVVTVATSNTLPNPLQAATYYYVIYVDANTIKLASSLANSLLPIPQAISLTTSGTGTMTTSLYPAALDYFNVWQNLTPSNALVTRPYADQMSTVINYFTNLGYTILRQTNPQTNNSMQWNVMW